MSQLEQLRYLATATTTEWDILGRTAALMLDTGDWMGVATAAGGWIETAGFDDEALSWHIAAIDFAERYRVGPTPPTEGLLRHAAYDLASELAYHRGWCPHKPWDKHLADEPDNPMALLGEPSLLLLECKCPFHRRRVYEGASVTSSSKGRNFARLDKAKNGAPRDAGECGGIVDGDQLRDVIRTHAIHLVRPDKRG